MECNTIITIGRQYGSGGREIGHKLAEALGIKYYDNELLDRAAKDSGICQELFENHDEKPSNSFLYSLVMDTRIIHFYLIHIHTHHLTQKTLKKDLKIKIAKKFLCMI